VILELTLVGAGRWLWKKKKHRTKKTKNFKQSTKGIVATKSKFPSRTEVKRFVHDLNQAMAANGRDVLLEDMDPKQKEMKLQAERKSKRESKAALGIAATAVTATFLPVLFLPAAVGVLYLSRDTFKLIARDFKRRHFISSHLIGMSISLGMLFTGHLILAAIASVMGNFFSRLINRIEDNTQGQLIQIFASHPEKVWVIKEGVEIQINFSELQQNDLVCVNAGEVVPADGWIESGFGLVDQHMLTGESQPIEKEVGNEVFASTLLISGKITLKVKTTGKETVASQIGEVLNQTHSYKDNLMLRGRKIGDRFIPIKLGISLLTLRLLGGAPSIAIMCSDLGGTVGVTSPIALLTYLQILSQNKILVKDGRIFESLREVDTFVFDKTGTLTVEQPSLGKIHAVAPFDETEVLRFAAAAEYRQPHPIAKAIVARAEAEGISLPAIDEASYEVGFGIKVMVEKKWIRVGSARFLKREGIDIPESIQPIEAEADINSHSLIYIAIDNELAGLLEMQPTLRPEIREVIDTLRARDIEMYIISGDHEAPTRRMAEELGIEKYYAETLPENKAKIVQQLKDEGRFVCFVGDGINDTIALKTAQVSISLKGASTAATDTAQIVFMDGTLQPLPKLFELVDEFEKTLSRNLINSFGSGISTLIGVYFFHFGIGLSMLLFYLGCFASLGNALLPLAKHQDKSLEVLPAPEKDKEEL
jgi:Cu2+-exporting ATPase